MSEESFERKSEEFTLNKVQGESSQSALLQFLADQYLVMNQRITSLEMNIGTLMGGRASHVPKNERKVEHAELQHLQKEFHELIGSMKSILQTPIQKGTPVEHRISDNTPEKGINQGINQTDFEINADQARYDNRTSRRLDFNEHMSCDSQRHTKFNTTGDLFDIICNHMRESDQLTEYLFAPKFDKQ